MHTTMEAIKDSAAVRAGVTQVIVGAALALWASWAYGSKTEGEHRPEVL